MIQSKEDYLYYLEADRIAIHPDHSTPPYMLIYESDIIWKFQRLLRKCEYYHNCKQHGLWKIYYKFLQYRLFRMQKQYSLGIPMNVFGPGFSISHLGPIVINGFAKVGKNCRLHPFTQIGIDGKNPGVAEIGDNVYISCGAKIIGPVKIADGITIGANAVVTKSFETPNITIAGVPAKLISDHGNLLPESRRGADIAKRKK